MREHPSLSSPPPLCRQGPGAVARRRRRLAVLRGQVRPPQRAAVGGPHRADKRQHHVLVPRCPRVNLANLRVTTVPDSASVEQTRGRTSRRRLMPCQLLACLVLVASFRAANDALCPCQCYGPEIRKASVARAGWQFNGEGRAISIPQARFDSEAGEATALRSKRSCAITYPTQVRTFFLVLLQVQNASTAVRS